MKNLIPNCSEFVERIELSKEDLDELTKLLQVHCGITTICGNNKDNLTWRSFIQWLDAKVGEERFLADEDAAVLRLYLTKFEKR